MDGQLPARPRWDKQFLIDLIKGKRVLCSRTTLASLPASMTDTAYFTTDINAEYDINFGIDTFSKARPDLLMVVRSHKDLNGGYVFRLNNWELIHANKDMELYK